MKIARKVAGSCLLLNVVNMPCAFSTGNMPTVEPGLNPHETQVSINELAAKQLIFPIQGIDPQTIKGSFYERRGDLLHNAVDILAPRNTPVLAVDDGKIARLWLSKAGGNTIYQYNPTNKYVYYYAHLERYAAGMAQGISVHRGQVIGFVGTSGNAPPNTPHLHFSISKLLTPTTWWSGFALDPYEIFKGSKITGPLMAPQQLAKGELPNLPASPPIKARTP